MPIKNIIFDLGGVIIDIDYNRTSEAFKKLGALNFDAVYTQSKQDDLFDNYDIGKINSATFRTILQKKLSITINDKEFDDAWNAMLLDIPQERLKFIKNLKNNYKVFLFSNTNDIHIKEVFNICQRQNGFNSFEGHFDKEYYSHIFGQRKPNPSSFSSILAENKLQASETLFVDDSMQHILGAKQAGLHTMHISKEKSIFDVLIFLEQLTKSEELEEKRILTCKL